ncbi:MAG: exodeoxyribonuclease VII large subunit, partial [Desulfohalobiaceae bacterium]
MPHIFSISELNQAIQEVLQGEFPLIWVRGQVGSLSKPGSGHVYFTLKDDRASLQVVWFKSSQTGRGAQQALKELDTGLEVLCAGRISVYPPRGTYQLLADTSLGTMDVPVPAPRFQGQVSPIVDIETRDERHVSLALEGISRDVAPEVLTVPIFPAHEWERRTGEVEFASASIQGEVTEALVWDNLEPIGSGVL